MALRKFLFQSSAEFYHEEQAATDELALGKLSLSGIGGVALDGGGQRAANFGTPTAAGDLATKSYVDSVAVGLDVKSSVRVKTVASVAAYTASGSGVGKTLTAPSTATSHNTHDGVLLAVNDRVLVSQAGGDDVTADADNGIYYVSQLGDAGSNSFTLTRATDADQNAEVTAGMFVFVTEGTVAGDTGWALVTNDPITVDTTALQFSQFSTAVSVTYDQGLVQTGASVKVDLDTAAAAQTAGAGGGSSGLEFDVNSAAGKLRAAVNATGGLERSASGLAALLNGTTLQSGASGLSVKGLPALFEVATVAVSANVTAANLNTLTGDVNADSLHDHEDVVMLRTASGAIVKGDGVYYSGNNVVSTGDCTNDTKSRIIGVADAAISDTVAGKIKKMGVVTGVLSGAAAGTRYFMSSAGQPVLAGTLAGGDRTIQLGLAKNATDLEVQIFDYGKKAA